MAVSALLPPTDVSGMTSLDRNLFIKKLLVPTLNVPAQSICLIAVILKPYLLKINRFKSIQDDETDPAFKIIYLNPDKVTSFESFDEGTQEVLRTSSITLSNFKSRLITMTYDNWKAHEIISAVLPFSLKFSSFSIIGKIIHLNLKNKLLPYKKLIAQVLLDKQPNCKSVVNKIHTIDTQFRNFKMELLAGNPDLKTEVKEYGIRYELDFSKVYWNPRLHEEHGRIIEKLQSGDVLYDVFCGIGPFALPAAINGCEVLANDLNPEAIHWLQRNIALNKITSGIMVFNEPGEEFIKTRIKTHFLEKICDSKYANSNFHIVMNLPEKASTFLPNFIGLLENETYQLSHNMLPIVHLYCFIKDIDEPETEAVRLVQKTLGWCISNNSVLEKLNVRNVAPNKEMIRVSFRLNEDVLRGNIRTKRGIESFDETVSKKLRLDDCTCEVINYMEFDDNEKVKKSEQA